MTDPTLPGTARADHNVATRRLSPGARHAGAATPDHLRRYGPITRRPHVEDRAWSAAHDQPATPGRCEPPPTPEGFVQRATPGRFEGAKGSRRTHRLASLGVLLAVAVGAAACSSGSSSAASSSSSAASSPTVKAKSHSAHGTGPSGVVISVNPTTLTLHTKSATDTVGLSSTTKYKEGGTDVTLSDLVVGDHVKIRLAKKAATPTAATVLIVPPSVTGTVGALSAAGFTLSTPAGKTDTVTTSAATVYRSGKQATSASSLHDGDRVRVSGQLSTASGSITAATVTILPAKKT